MLITTIYSIFLLGLVNGSALKGGNTKGSWKANHPSLLKIESIFSMTSALSGILCEMHLTFDCRSLWNIRRPIEIVMFLGDTRTTQSKCRMSASPWLALEILITVNLFNIYFRLGSWVSKQRWQYKKFIKGKSSHITQDRIDSLNDIGFIWDFYQDAFDFRLSQLVEYKVANGDCNVPRVYNYNPE